MASREAKKYRHPTLRTRRRYAFNRVLVSEAKDKPCADCGICYPPHVMDLHHKDRDAKSFSIGAALSSKTSGQVRAEIAKCDVICANCHREREWKEGNDGSSEA